MRQKLLAVARACASLLGITVLLLLAGGSAPLCGEVQCILQRYAQVPGEEFHPVKGDDWHGINGQTVYRYESQAASYSINDTTRMADSIRIQGYPLRITRDIGPQAAQEEAKAYARHYRPDLNVDCMRLEAGRGNTGSQRGYSFQWRAVRADGVRVLHGVAVTVLLDGQFESMIVAYMPWQVTAWINVSPEQAIETVRNYMEKHKNQDDTIEYQIHMPHLSSVDRRTAWDVTMDMYVHKKDITGATAMMPTFYVDVETGEIILPPE